MKKKILIIGFGNIGFRHFESLYKNKKNFYFYLYDKDVNNIFSKIKSLKNIRILNKLIQKEIKNIYFDLIVIATPSIKRFDIFKKITRNLKFKNMLIEKFLFNEKKNYEHCLRILDKINSRIYVHCPRPEWKYFIDLKKIIKGKINLEYKGFNWRMASNSIHFLDLFSFLIGSSEIKLNKIRVKDKISSKRDNYMEFRGKMSFLSKNQSTLTIDDDKKYKSSLMKIKFASFTDEIHINKGKMELIRRKLKKKIFHKQYKIPLTSNLTGKIVNKIFNKKKVNLTELKKSVKLHMILFPIFMKILGKTNKKIKYLPIT